MTGAAWIILEDRSNGPWPNQAGDTMPGASQQAIKDAISWGTDFRVLDYGDEVRYVGKAYPASILAEGFTTDDGRPAVDPDVANLVQVLDGTEWVNIYDYVDPARDTG